MQPGFQNLKYTIDHDRRVIIRLADKVESNPIPVNEGLAAIHDQDVVGLLCYMTWLVEESDHWDKGELVNALLEPWFIRNQ